ncbi:MAG TPA: SOS response-associated peptidase [bacterium]|nr:SOS response-associated peptidase [bacterium]
MGFRPSVGQGSQRNPAADQRTRRARREVGDVPGRFAHRRCLVPAGMFYEWQRIPGQRRKQPYAIGRTDGRPMALAGLWEAWRAPDESREVRTFTIVTTAANEDVAALHHRMPVIVEEADWSAWLGEGPGAIRDLLRPSPNGTLRSWPVSPRVNSPVNNGPELVEPLALVGAG